MSSEGTLSVGREGEMGNLSSSSSSSSSVGNESRTSVCGGSGVQEYSIIPTNILEVDDRRDRCYDEREKVVGEVIRYKSCWKGRGELGYLVENYDIPPHVLVKPTKTKEWACLTPKDHWMPLYVHYLATGLWFPILELLVALLKEYRIELTQLVPNGVRGGRRSSSLLMIRRGGEEMEELSKWKGKKLNPNKYQLGEVESLDRVGGELVDIMYLTNLEVVESSRIYGRSSLSGAIRLPEKRSKALTLGGLEERVEGGTLRPHQSGRARAEVGLSSKPRRRATEEEVATRKRQRVEKGKSSVPFTKQTLSFLESSKTATKRFINSHFPEVDLQRTRDEVALNGGAGVVRHALKIANLVNAMVVEFFNCL
ncbi:hypothetical protein SLEP1_g29046 [Rubroshorea leprosula]|uniref:Uncharacterized protein n=1 Tax=Rubroshorea leprosula TaxID=152421 RepID=A0AAV5K6M6_9ROSI|nr:hypothetical protein SLEP1_g29046 [Rubroshorea leprosula]